MPLKVLIIGGGVCGPALALLLGRAGPSADQEPRFDITVVERYPGIRKNGLQIDLRAQGITVIKRLGLDARVKARLQEELGFTLIDQRGRACATFGTNDSGQGQQAFTSEYEIMRGDLVDVLHSASVEEAEQQQQNTAGSSSSNSTLRYEFGVSVTDLQQQEEDDDDDDGNGKGVDVTFSDGRTARYDAVVGADGQGSRTRRLLLGAAASAAAFRSFGLLIAYFTAPRLAGQDAYAKWYAMPRRRLAILRSGPPAAGQDSQVILGTMLRPRARIAEVLARDLAGQKRAFADLFADAGYAVPEALRALRADGNGAADFYAQEMAQVRCDTLARGRVALLGDAGYCPSPASGMGTTLALVGAYILAGELARCRGAGEVPAALAAYADKVRPFVDVAQKLPPGSPEWAYLETGWGVWLFNTILAWVAWSGIIDWINRIMPADKGGLALPEYPELRLEK
ncbi:monooxygenase [Xylariomycetidae sp. FL0641]|nr:monooxygenase [Xylariomycetidae sp. FL0641]